MKTAPQGVTPASHGNVKAAPHQVDQDGLRRRRTSLSPSSDRNPLSEYYQAQRNPYAQRSSPVLSATSPLQLHLMTERQRQALRSRGRQPLKGRQSSPRGKTPSFFSIVKALFRWCKVIWSPKRRHQSQPVALKE